MTAAFAIGCIGCLMFGYALGAWTNERRRTKRADDLHELRMLLTGHVEAVEFETIARKVGAA